MAVLSIEWRFLSCAVDSVDTQKEMYNDMYQRTSGGWWRRYTGFHAHSVLLAAQDGIPVVRGAGALGGCGVVRAASAHPPPLPAPGGPAQLPLTVTTAAGATPQPQAT